MKVITLIKLKKDKNNTIYFHLIYLSEDVFAINIKIYRH